VANQRVRAFRARLLYRAVVAIAAVGRRIPLRIGRALGRTLGTLAWHVLRRERIRALRNIAIAFPEWSEERRRDVIRGMLRHHGMSLFEIAWLPNVDAGTMHRTTTVTNFEPILTHLRSGRGVIAFTGHCGNWEWFAYTTALGLGEHPMSVLQRERDQAEMNRFITELRARAGIRTIDRGSTSSAREMFQAIRRAELLCFLVDQNIRTESVKVPFFGVPALTPIGPAKLAIRTGAVIVIGFIERGADGLQHAHWSDPIETSRDDDPVALTVRITRAIEEQIRRAPEQWVWMHDRWRERPRYELRIED
jgi:Kdo2-lipid IVA lauroyltransferase/acyltransferase